MSRNPLIEAIHEARYDLETCAAHEQAAYRKNLDDLLGWKPTRSLDQILQSVIQHERDGRRAIICSL